MKLVMVRHGPAADRAWCVERGKPDALRPLTTEGRRKMRAAARGLARIAPALDLVASSNLVRARETAEIVARACEVTRILALPELQPEAAPAELVAWLRTRSEGAIGLVGHEPHLGLLVGSLLADAPIAPVTFKKGQACLVEFDGQARSGRGRLAWSLAPRQLRHLGR